MALDSDQKSRVQISSTVVTPGTARLTEISNSLIPMPRDVPSAHASALTTLPGVTSVSSIAMENVSFVIAQFAGLCPQVRIHMQVSNRVVDLVRNQSVKSSLRTAIRAFREAAAAGDKDKANELLVSASRKLDKAASKGVIHANQAANRKSAMAKRAASL